MQYDNVKRHVKFSPMEYIKLLDDEDEEGEHDMKNSIAFSIDFTSAVDVFHDHQLLLDTCASESVFRTRTLFYDIVCTYAPIIIH